MANDTQTATREILEGVEQLRRSESQLARRMSSRRAPNETDRDAMRFITEAPGDAPVTPGDLASHLRISTAAVTSVLRRLLERGQVLVAAHPDDARSKVVRPTLRDINAPVDDMTKRVEALASEFTPEQTEIVARFLRRLAEEIDDIS
ncbi:MarR family winged helix-turn-helix transcriptional regulator [Microbacterium sp. NPDC089695]|uniref:MarR family winged helix-turn-helix transcriptional regulator n=1 Tax=Microbacterium sp. NPDC089695 TaxID=3364198 RepID=UPI0037FD5E0A